MAASGVGYLPWMGAGQSDIPTGEVPSPSLCSHMEVGPLQTCFQVGFSMDTARELASLLLKSYCPAGNMPFVG